MTIFLDLDEVLADFTSQALAVHGWTRDRLDGVRQDGIWGMYQFMGITTEQFWEPIHARGEAFWESIEILPWANDVLNLVKEYSVEWYIVTSPSRCITSWRGKLNWMYRFFCGEIRHCLVTPHKHLLAKKGTILIDDREENINKFMAYGGHGILFPRYCNRLYYLESDPVSYVRSELEDFIIY